MKNDRLFKAIGDVDNALLERAESLSEDKKKKTFWAKWGSVAACICLVALGASVADFHNRTENGIVGSFPSSQISGIYASPENGDVLLFDEVKAALKENEGKDTVYFVEIVIYSNETPLETDSEDVKNELKRLTKEGYKVCYATQWTYQGDMEKTDIVYTAGYFTAEQLNNFAVNEKYGYAFSFATNGDGSAVDVNQEEFSSVN